MNLKFLMAFFSAIAFGALISAVTSCAPFRDSPFSDKLLSKDRSLNEQAQGRIQNIESDGLLRMAIIADVHQNYSDLNTAIYSINQTTNIDFTVNLGDFTNSGYNLEYDQYIDSITSLRRPAFTVIGNHDSIGAGPELYRKAFSEVNFWFESSSKRFIFFNSANWENPNGFDPQWLKDAVTSSTKSVIIFTHCSLQDKERARLEVSMRANQGRPRIANAGVCMRMPRPQRTRPQNTD